MKQFLTVFCAMLLAVAMLLNIVGCETVMATNLTENLTRETVMGKPTDEAFLFSQMQFAAKLFRESAKESEYENTLISPLSVMLALAMTANGAEGMTKEEMETVLGGLPMEELNEYLYTYISSLSEEVKTANSIWFKDGDMNPKQEFLQTNKNYYDAEIFSAPFDHSTVKQINGWVKDNTDGMIDKILEEINGNALMYLVNALTFEAQWSVPYEKNQVHEAVFTGLDGKDYNVEMMCGEEYSYMESENATGFLKNYKDNNYQFAAFLPKEGVDFADFVDSLTADTVSQMLKNAMGHVITGLPKFEYDYSLTMNDVLKTLGMESAFSANDADFSDIADDLYIGNVLHKTYICVDTKGTKAGAVTSVGLCGSAAVTKPKEVILDRPFVYMIVDKGTNLPVFIGTVTNFD